nr:MAG TPA: hypothetical protein [Caudoviricetes sp.]
MQFVYGPLRAHEPDGSNSFFSIKPIQRGSWQ